MAFLLCIKTVGGVPRDEAIARKYLERGANLGFPQAQYMLGEELKRLSTLGKAEIVDAEQWLLKAAESHCEQAYTSLYHLYRRNAILKDQKKSIEWLHRASLTGDSYSLHLFGLACLNGEGVEKDVVEAAKWFFLAACQDDRMQKYAQKDLDGVISNMNEDSIQSVVERVNHWLNENACNATAFLGVKLNPLKNA